MKNKKHYTILDKKIQKMFYLEKDKASDTELLALIESGCDPRVRAFLIEEAKDRLEDLRVCERFFRWLSWAFMIIVFLHIFLFS